MPHATPRISVIIPTYNREWCVLEAVDSVRSQTYTDFEVIVVDDGSTDNTNRRLEAASDAIRLLRQDNKGVSAARNSGAALARGQWLAFLDSDDLWLPEKLAWQYEYIETHPDVVICQTEEYWYRNGRRVNPKKRHQKPSGMFFTASLSLCLVSPSAVMIRKDVFEAFGGFDISLPACEDYDLWLRIGLQYPIHLIDTPLIIKRGGHPDQLSSAPGLDRYRIQALAKIIRTEALTPEQHQAAVSKLIEKCEIYANGCQRRGRRDEAAQYRTLAAEIALTLQDRKDR